MKYCTNCGAELADEAVVCVKCGCAAPNTSLTVQNRPVSGLRLAAKIFMIISTIVSGFALIPLAWTVPMTVSYSKKIARHERVSTGFKVCTLLFVGLIAGILMLCDDEQP